MCGNAVAKDGSLLFSDDRNGVIYRVRYTGDKKAGAELAAEVGTPPQVVRGPIAIEAPEAKTEGKLKVTSAAFASGSPIPPT